MSLFSGLLRGVGRVLDPNRLAMAQAFVEGDYGAAAALAQRFRQLQEEHDRLRMANRRKRKFSAVAGPSAAMGEESTALPWARGNAVAGPAGYGLDAVGLADERGHFVRPQESPFVEPEDAAYLEWTRDLTAQEGFGRPAEGARGSTVDGAGEMLFPLEANFGFERRGGSGAPVGRQNRQAAPPDFGSARGRVPAGVDGHIDLESGPARAPGAAHRILEDAARSIANPSGQVGTPVDVDDVRRRDLLGIDQILAESKKNQAIIEDRRRRVEARRQRPGLNGWGYVPQQGDRELLARIIYAESFNTPEDDEAIGWATINRVGRQGFATTLDGVLGQPGQFQIVSEGNRGRGDSRHWTDSANPSALPSGSRARYARALAVADGILTGRIPDPTDDAPFFHASLTPNDPTSDSPWFTDALRRKAIVPARYQSRARGSRRNYFYNDNPPRSKNEGSRR